MIYRANALTTLSISATGKSIFSSKHKRHKNNKSKIKDPFGFVVIRFVKSVVGYQLETRQFPTHNFDVGGMLLLVI